MQFPYFHPEAFQALLQAAEKHTISAALPSAFYDASLRAEETFLPTRLQQCCAVAPVANSTDCTVC
jgi:hypothetical protein